MWVGWCRALQRGYENEMRKEMPGSAEVLATIPRCDLPKGVERPNYGIKGARRWENERIGKGKPCAKKKLKKGDTRRGS